MHPKKPTLMLCVAVASAAFAVNAIAANWLTVASDGSERVEIDLTRIARAADGRTLAWDRLVFGHEVRSKDHGKYTSVEALNRYDCQRRRFATVRRVFLHGDNPVGDESVPAPKELGVIAGAVDDRLLTEACRLRTVGEMKQIAEEAGKAAAASEAATAEQPRAMHADMRAAAEPPKLAAAPNADAGAADAGACQPAGAAAEKPAEPLLPKRLIELPRIDKSQVERPKDSTSPKVAEAEKPKSGGARRATDREKQYATSGPRKSVKKKPPEQRRSEAAVPVATNVPWSYGGAGGPAAWGKLRPEYATCALGKRQSPIDIRDAIHVDLEPIAIDYREAHFRIIDTGHTVQVNVGEGSTMSVMGRQYRLEKIEFHHPAEERIEGRGFDMVAHLVHRDVENRVAIVSVLIERGSEHAVIQTLWNNLPLEVDQELAPRELIDLNKLLPENRAYMAYMGSLTAPPCTEEVLWLVFRNPISVSSEQMDIFARIYPNNARPLQPANGRLIKESR
jgi:carbonic anhydrase